MRSVLRQVWWWTPWALAAIIVTAVVVYGIVAHSDGRKLPPTRARHYSNAQACLLVGPKGLREAGVAPVWAGMQDASSTTKTKVSYLAMSGPQTVDVAATYVTTLVQRQCDVVLAVGATEVAAVGKQAAAFPKTRFVEVGGADSAANVVVVDDSSASSTRMGVASIVRDATK